MVQIQGTGFSKIDKGDTKVAGIKTFLQRKVNERLNKMTEEGKTPFGTNIGGSAVGEEGMGSFVNPKEVSTNYFSPGGGASQETKVASADLSGIDFGAKDFASNFAKGINKEETEKKNFFDGAQLADNTYKSTFESDVKPDYTDTYKETLKILGDGVEEKKSVEPPKASSYYDQTVKEDKYGIPHITGDTLNEVVAGRIKYSKKYSNLDDYVRKNISYGVDKDGTPTATSTSLYNYGQPLNLSTEKLKSFMVQDAKEDQVAREKESYESLKKAMQEDEAADYQKTLQAEENYKTSVLVDKYGFDPREYINPNVPPGTRINEKTGLQEIPERYQKPNPFVDPTDKNYLGDSVVPESLRTNFVEKTKLGTMPSMTISEEGRKLAEQNKTPKVEVKQPSVFDKTMNFLGNVTNTMLGIQPAGASQIGPVNVKTKETTAPVGGYNISPEGKVKALQNRIEAGIKSTGIPNNVAVQGGAMSQAAIDQAAINRGIRAAELTGIPSGMATQGGVTTQSAIQAGIKARQEAAEKRATDLRNMRAAQGIASGNPNVSIVGGKAIATNNTGVARAQAMAINRKISGKSISQVKAANQQSMRDSAEARHAAFKKTGVQTASARKQAAKASVQAAAKKRHAAFKARRAAKKKSKKK